LLAEGPPGAGPQSAAAGSCRGNNVIKFIPDKSVLKLDIGDRIRLDAAQFERLSNAFFTEIQAKFL
jgi:hypothetical protein